MSRIALVAAGLVAALALAAPIGATSSVTKLTGSVGPGFTITLKSGGTKVTKLKAGTYTVKVADKSSIHNFHLTGPGVNKKTSVGAQVSTTWKVTFKTGTYKFVCDPHAAFMKGSFKVT